MTTFYLLRLDRLIREAVSTRCHTARRVVIYVQQWHSVNGKNVPAKRLVWARMFRILDIPILEKLFRKSTAKVSYREIQTWRNQSISQLKQVITEFNKHNRDKEKCYAQ